MSKKEQLPRINREIDVDKIRLIDDAGNMLGVISTKEAIFKARDKNLDLVEVSPTAKPPVCKILDFGKYKYMMQKKAHEAKKKQKVIEIKEIKFRPNIGEHDFQIKLKQLSKFLTSGDKVKITIRFRGREIAKQEIALELMQNVVKATAEIAKIEIGPKMEGRQMLLILAPQSTKSG